MLSLSLLIFVSVCKLSASDSSSLIFPSSLPLLSSFLLSCLSPFLLCSRITVLDAFSLGEQTRTQRGRARLPPTNSHATIVPMNTTSNLVSVEVIEFTHSWMSSCIAPSSSTEARQQGGNLQLHFSMSSPYLASRGYADFNDNVLTTSSCEQPRARARVVFVGAALLGLPDNNSQGSTPHLALRFLFSNGLLLGPVLFSLVGYLPRTPLKFFCWVNRQIGFWVALSRPLCSD